MVITMAHLNNFPLISLPLGTCYIQHPHRRESIDHSRVQPLPPSVSSAAMASEHHLFEIGATQLAGNCPAATYSPSCTPFGFSAMSRAVSSWSPRIGGYDWECSYSTDPSAGTVSLGLHLPCGNIREPHDARFKFSLLDREGRPVPSRTRASSFQNWSTRQRWDWACDDFITRQDLERPEYLKDGSSFTVRCDIALKPSTAKVADAFVTVPPSDLHQHLGDLLASKEGADVTFRLVAGGETFSAHRCVLAARSPVFRAQLFGEMKEAAAVIAVDDMEAPVFGSLLSFIYTDSLPLPEGRDDDGAMALYQRLLAAADMYGLERMKLACQEKLCRHVRANSVASMLALADLHHCPGLKDACFAFLCSSANLDTFAETDGLDVLADTCPAVLKELLAKLATVLIFE